MKDSGRDKILKPELLKDYITLIVEVYSFRASDVNFQRYEFNNKFSIQTITFQCNFMKFQKLVSSELDVYSYNGKYRRNQSDEVFKKSKFRLNDLPDFSKTKENVLLVVASAERHSDTACHCFALFCFCLRLFL